MRGRHPVDRPLDAARGGGAIERVEIDRAAQLRDRPRGVLDDLVALQDVGVSQPHLAAGREPEELLHRHLHEVVLLDVQLAGERHLPRASRRVLGVVRRRDLFDAPRGIVRDDDFQGTEHRERPLRAPVQVLAHGVLEQRDVDHVFLLGDADARAEVANGLGRVAAPPQSRNRRHARVVPAGDEPLLDERQELPLAHHRVVQVQPRELDLLRPRAERGVVADVVHDPVVQRAMILELERAQRVRNPLDRIRYRVGVVVDRIDAPGVARAVMRRVADPVEGRIPHVDVGRRHVDLRAQHVRAVGKLAGPHPPEHVHALGDGPIAIRAVAARLRQRAAVFANLVGREAVDVRLVVPNELLGARVHQLEVVGCVEHPVAPIEPEPPDVVLD